MDMALRPGTLTREAARRGHTTVASLAPAIGIPAMRLFDLHAGAPASTVEAAKIVVALDTTYAEAFIATRAEAVR